MKRTISGLAMVAAGFAMMVAANPGSAHAGGVVDDLRARGLGKWVDRYVEEDDKGKVSYKSSTSPDSKATAAPAKKPTTRTLKAKAPTSKALKRVTKKKGKKKFSAKRLSKKKTASKKYTTRKLSNKKLGKKKLKKFSKRNTSKKVTSNASSDSKKKYKVPSNVKDRLASYGINL